MITIRVRGVDCYQCGRPVRGEQTLCYRCSYDSWRSRLLLAIRLWRCAGYDGRPTTLRDAMKVAGVTR